MSDMVQIERAKLAALDAIFNNMWHILQDVNSLLKEARERIGPEAEKAAVAEDSLDPFLAGLREQPAQAGEGMEKPKLCDYAHTSVNAKISGDALWKHLLDLQDAANDPTKVKEWADKIWDEFVECRVMK